MICQRTTKAVVYCFTKGGFLADVYLDDFYGADVPARALHAFQRLKNLLHELGLQTSPDKECPPSTNMVCLGVEVDSEHFTLSVTATRVQDLRTELAFWSSREFYTLKQLKSLLGKLSFVAACVRPGRIFVSRLLNNLRAFPSTRARFLRTCKQTLMKEVPLKRGKKANHQSNPSIGSLTICSLQQMPP